MSAAGRGGMVVCTGKEFPTIPKVNLDVASMFWKIVFHGMDVDILSEFGCWIRACLVH